MGRRKRRRRAVRMWTANQANYFFVSFLAPAHSHLCSDESNLRWHSFIHLRPTSFFYFFIFVSHFSSLSPLSFFPRFLLSCLPSIFHSPLSLDIKYPNPVFF